VAARGSPRDPAEPSLERAVSDAAPRGLAAEARGTTTAEQVWPMRNSVPHQLRPPKTIPSQQAPHLREACLPVEPLETVVLMADIQVVAAKHARTGVLAPVVRAQSLRSTEDAAPVLVARPPLRSNRPRKAPPVGRKHRSRRHDQNQLASLSLP